MNNLVFNNTSDFFKKGFSRWKQYGQIHLFGIFKDFLHLKPGHQISQPKSRAKIRLINRANGTWDAPYMSYELNVLVDVWQNVFSFQPRFDKFSNGKLMMILLLSRTLLQTSGLNALPTKTKSVQKKIYN